MLGDTCDSDSCGPRQRFSAVLFSSLPFVVSFGLVATAVSQKLWPLLSGGSNGKRKDAASPGLPMHNYEFEPRTKKKVPRPSVRHLSGFTFSANFALSAVLVELILCDISNALNPAARSLVLKVTLPSLLFLLILVSPALELHSIISAAGWDFGGTQKRTLRAAWLIEIAGLACWLWLFWYLGRGLLGVYLHEETYLKKHSFSEGCLERIGVIGIALMASLAGFAAVSAVWHTFGARNKPVTETEVSRKQAGLAATEDMLLAKRSRLRALERKMSEAPAAPGGFIPRVMGSIRGNADVTESNNLQLEISGLETMRMTLSSTLLSLQTRRREQLRAKTAIGRVCSVGNYVFAIYCAYRIGSALVNLSRRLVCSSPANASTDPVTALLALVAKHWDPAIDRVAWSRSISFLLSGFMLLASFNSALQTFLLLSRAFPALLRSTLHANLALLVSQVSATYVISSALLLRSNLPDDVRGGISEALGSPLNVRFVGRWFEGWFLGAVALTAFGIWAGKKWGGGGLGDDDEEAVELGSVEIGGKRS